jgi:hypothetical protein
MSETRQQFGEDMQQPCKSCGQIHHGALTCAIAERSEHAAASVPQGGEFTPTTADFDALLKAIWQAAGKFREKECNVIRDLIHYFNVKRQAAPGERTNKEKP